MKFIKHLLEMWALADLCRKTGYTPSALGAIVALHWFALTTISGKDKSEYDKVIDFYALSKAIVQTTL